MIGRASPVVIGEAQDAGTPTFDELYHAQWWPMLRLATGLVDARDAAEDVVQEAFAALYRRWGSLRDSAAAIGYLRACVVNGSRSVLRKRMVARRHIHIVDDGPTEAADSTSLLSAEHDAVRAALEGLPRRQREVLTLRYITELSDAEIAAATGLSEGGVRSASSRGLAALRTVLGGQL
jgi:RNA polymerase sigma-70 factor (sigma-E family)